MASRPAPRKPARGKHFMLLVKRHKAAAIGVLAVLVLSVGFTAKVIAEGRRAEHALDEPATRGADPRQPGPRA